MYFANWSISKTTKIITRLIKNQNRGFEIKLSTSSI
jgi:hypothetical protein